ncbi:MAG: hypothetical protein HZB39_18915 [Planctomycetes bacterium]|nr:hypothetical protein [Planctomycetota bacterium]
MRARQFAVLTVLLGSACGGLSVRIDRGPIEFITPDGRRWPGLVEVQEEYGPAGFHPVGVILGEPFDVVLSTASSIQAVFDPDLRIAWGPLGWLASLTPLVTASGPVKFMWSWGSWGPVPVDESQLTALRDGDAEQRLAAARAATGDERIVSARLTSDESLPATRR